MPSSLRRRDVLRLGLCSAGALGLSFLPSMGQPLFAADPVVDPLAPKNPHFAAKAKRLVYVFLNGGISHIDSFDPKPKIASMVNEKAPLRYDGKPQVYRPSDWKFEKFGRCGMDFSELFPNLAKHADSLSMIRSMHTDHANHFEATLAMHCGSVTIPMPSIGSWLSYGLGTENRSLPSYLVIARDMPYAGSQVWDSSFLPGVHQGVRIVPGAQPIANLTSAVALSQQDRELALLAELGAANAAQRGNHPMAEARLSAFATARGMEDVAPRLFDLSKESPATRALYGDKELSDPKSLAWDFLVARRMLEAGVRTVEIISGGSASGWDAHGHIRGNHTAKSAAIDKPVAAFLTDLGQRGLLKDTLVVFCTEFGRTAVGKVGPEGGREHHPRVFSCWMAGGGVKAGYIHGASDELGEKVASDGVHLHDFHATILHLMGFDHTKLTHRHAGRDYRLTDVKGEVVHKLLV